jgi:hypothetical protein
LGIHGNKRNSCASLVASRSDGTSATIAIPVNIAPS